MRREVPFSLQVMAFAITVFPFLVLMNCWFWVQIYDTGGGVCGCVKFTFTSYQEDLSGLFHEN